MKSNKRIFLTRTSIILLVVKYKKQNNIKNRLNYVFLSELQEESKILTVT